MSKFIKTAAGALILCLMLSLCAPMARAAGGTVIDSAEDLLEFAEKCRLDSYSSGLTVLLTADIDLSGVEFEGIPTFGGNFIGGGHTISGLEIGGSGSYKGLFRYVRAGATVTGLNVKGAVIPGGSHSNVGGIAGENKGIIIGCTFSGEVAGADNVGGIAGVNGLGGIIDGCVTNGTVRGTHFVGGAAGVNMGVIRGFVNRAEINATAQENEVQLGDITLDTLAGTESAASVTDIGGVAGGNSGVIRACSNNGTVGYRQMSYNIGGIAGSHSGYIVGCVNTGAVYGRKEVGGIAGQMEPATNVLYQVDTLQMLKEELEELSVLTDAAVANAQGAASSVSGHLGKAQGHINSALDAIESLLPDEDNPTLPDEDTITAAQNALSGSLTGVSSSINGALGALGSLAGGLSGDMGKVAEQTEVISAIVDGASENLGGTVTDISDLDTEIDLTGKIADCTNRGAVHADLNAGGIVGAVSIENDFDPEDDVQTLGESSFNVDCQMRAVILRCENRGDVSVTKQNGGGIVGWALLGLVKDCFSSGAVGGTAAVYVGGTVGISQGYIRGCGAKVSLEGVECVGGIAGAGSTVTDCRSMARISGAEERLGAVLGAPAEGGNEISGNYYLPINGDTGAIDGISYEGKAQAMTERAFFALEGLDRRFVYQTVTFVDGGNVLAEMTVAYGETVDAAQLPQFVHAEAQGCWLDENGLPPGEVRFDTVFTAAYVHNQSTVESNMKSEGRPVLLAEGEFAPGESLGAGEYSGGLPLVEEGEAVLSLSYTAPQGTQKLRCLLPQGAEAERMQLWLLEGGAWRTVETHTVGSYLVFDAQAGDGALCIVELPRDMRPLMAACAGGALVLVLGAALTAAKKKRRAAKTEATQ